MDLTICSSTTARQQLQLEGDPSRLTVTFIGELTGVNRQDASRAGVQHR